MKIGRLFVIACLFAVAHVATAQNTTNPPGYHSGANTYTTNAPGLHSPSTNAPTGSVSTVNAPQAKAVYSGTNAPNFAATIGCLYNQFAGTNFLQQWISVAQSTNGWQIVTNASASSVTLPANLVTNNEANVALSGTFSSGTATLAAAVQTNDTRGISLPNATVGMATSPNNLASNFVTFVVTGNSIYSTTNGSSPTTWYQQFTNMPGIRSLVSAGKFQTVCTGQPGTQMTNWLSQITNLVLQYYNPNGPDIASCNGPENDLIVGTPLSTVLTSASNIVQTLHSNRWLVFLNGVFPDYRYYTNNLYNNPFSYANLAGYRAAVDGYNAWVRTSYSNHFIDYTIDTPAYMTPADDAPDALHPQWIGCEKFASLTYAALFGQSGPGSPMLRDTKLAQSQLPNGLMPNGIYDGVQLWFNFSEGSGVTAYDSSPNQLSATITTNWPAFGNMFGYALPLDGFHYAIVASNPVFNVNSPFTVSCWFAASATNAIQNSILVCRDSSGSGSNIGDWALTVNGAGNGIGFYLRTSGGFVNGGNVASSSFTNGLPHYCVATWDGVSSVKLYLDGQLGATAAATGITTNVNTGDFEIGDRNHQNGQNIPVGTIDDVGYWNRCLANWEIVSEYIWRNPVNLVTYGANAPAAIPGVAQLWFSNAVSAFTVTTSGTNHGLP